MNFKKYSVIEELFKLSQISDGIIEEVFSDTALHENLFEETKKGISQILNNKGYVTKSSGSSEKRGSFRYKMEPSLEPFLETRSTIHQKSSSEMPNENYCCEAALDLQEKPYGSNDTKISPILLSDNGNSIYCGNNRVELGTKRDVSNELCLSHKLGHKGCSKDNSEFNCTPSNSTNFQNTSCKRFTSFRTGRSEALSPISVESSTKAFQAEETVIISSSEDSFHDSQDTFHNKSNNRSNLKNKKRGTIFLDESEDTSERSPAIRLDSSVTCLDKTYTVSSGSSTENNVCDISVSNTLVSSCDSSKFSLNTNEQHKRDSSLKRRAKANDGSTKLHSSASFIGNAIKNPTEKIVHELSQTSLRTRRAKLSLNVNEEGLVRLKEQNNSLQYDYKCPNSSNPSSEYEGKLSDIRPRVTYRLRSLENKYEDVYKQLIDLHDNGNVNTNVHEEKSSGSTIDIQYSHTTVIQENKSSGSTLSGEINFSATSYSPQSSNRESKEIERNPGKESGIRENRSAKKEKISVPDFGSRKYKRNSKINKKNPRQLRTFSAPVNKKMNANQNPRPITPMEFGDFNPESLKVKAEEKRRQREIRVLKTKERRERLEQEKEERIRLSQQRLKQRFQQHEEMLKQKIEMFKIKSRNRQHSYTKRSGASTSSKDSKEDRTKDNDDFCRNSINSGQKLSKESNGYHDVSLEKDSLASLEGNVGPHPEISKKQNAIPVGCEKTPVEFSVSCDGKKLKQIEMISAVDNGMWLKDLKACGSERVNSHSKCPLLKCLENPCSEGASSYSKESSSSKSLNEEMKSESSSFKRINRIIVPSEQMPNTTGIEKIKSSYLLRSAVKQNKRKKLFANPVSPLRVAGSNKNNTAGYENAIPENITSSSDTDKKVRGKFCLKITTNKTKKSEKVPSYCKTYFSSGTDGISTQTRSVKCLFQDSSKESERVKSKKRPVRKKQEKISYEIPDSADDSSDETKVDPRKIPQWATGIYLKQAIIQQHYKPLNVEKIFGILPTDPVDLTIIFDKDKPEYHRRTSSDNWSINMTPE